MKKCNEMSWRKCECCRFLVDITGPDGIKFMCNITGETLLLKNCIYCDEKELESDYV